ncbi:MAG: DUF1569 domain-containing protein [Terrimonas sp.]|nr:DUF1569 domain-containing protein [Terrimonas sp.]
MTEEKIQFLQNDYLGLVRKIDPAVTALWGKMNAQQMVEHVTAFFKISSGRLVFPLVTPSDQLARYREFLMSEKPFRENTRAPASILPDEPLPLRNASMEAAIQGLDKSVAEFFACFKEDAGKKTLHPVFGELNFLEWVQLHHKHVTHHLRQFAVPVL